MQADGRMRRQVERRLDGISWRAAWYTEEQYLKSMGQLLWLLQGMLLELCLVDVKHVKLNSSLT